MIEPNVVEIFRKDEISEIDYTFDWSDWLGTGDVIVNSTWEYDNTDLEIVNVTRTATTATAFIRGGKGATVYRLANTVRTLAGRLDRRAVLVCVYPRAPMTAWQGSPAIFAAGRSVAALSTTINLVKDLLEVEVQASSHAVSSAVGNFRVIRSTGPMLSAARATGIIQPRVQLVSIARGSGLGKAIVFDPGGPPPPVEESDLWMGTAFDGNLRTLYTGNDVHTLATTSAQLASAIPSLRNGTLDEIWLVPGTVYSYPTNAFSQNGMNRPADNPARIRRDPTNNVGPDPELSFTYPCENKQAIVNGLAFHHVTFQNAAQFIINSMSQGGTPSQGISRDWLFEDCLILKGIDFHGGQVFNSGTPNDYDPMKAMLNICFRHCRIVDAYSWTGQVQGILSYGTQIKGMYNLLSHNGWDPAATRSTPAAQGGAKSLSHNFYHGRPVADAGTKYPTAPASEPPMLEKCVWKKNVMIRGSSHGGHFRNGGTITDNLFLGNALNQVGYWADNMQQYGTSGGIFTGNVCIGAEDINNAPSEAGQRGCFLWLAYVADLLIENNIASINNSIATTNRCFLHWDNQPSGYAPTNVTIRNNISYNHCPVGQAIHNPNNVPQAGVTYQGNHMEDGSNYANPGIAASYHADQVDAYLRTNGVTPAWIDAALAAIRAGFTIVP